MIGSKPGVLSVLSKKNLARCLISVYRKAEGQIRILTQDCWPSCVGGSGNRLRYWTGTRLTVWRLAKSKEARQGHTKCQTPFNKGGFRLSFEERYFDRLNKTLILPIVCRIFLPSGPYGKPALMIWLLIFVVAKSPRGAVFRTCAEKGQRVWLDLLSSPGWTNVKLLLRWGSCARTGSSKRGARSTGAPYKHIRMLPFRREGSGDLRSSTGRSSVLP